MKDFLSSAKAPMVLTTVLLLSFFLLKLNDAAMPFFWDELCVYANGATKLYENGLGLTPNTLDPEISRGHPLLFYNLNAIWMYVVGYSVQGRHLLPLIISVFFLWTLGRVVARHTNGWVGVGAIFFMAVQPVFWAQSTMILPEVTLSLLLLLGLDFYVQKKIWLAALFGILAILVKETAFVLVFTVVFCEILFFIFDKQRKDLNAFLRMAILSLPLVVWGGFLLVQKQQLGWYFFPLHESMIHFFDREAIKFWRDYYGFIFEDQGRLYFALTLYAVSLAYIIERYFVKKQPWGLDRALTVFLVFILFFFNISCFFAFMHRYMLPIMAPLVVVGSIVLYRIEFSKPIFKWALLIPMLILGVLNFKSKKFVYDVDVSCFDIVKNHLDVMSFIEKTSTEGKIMIRFPLECSRLFRGSGYFSENTPLRKENFTWDYTNEVVWGVWENEGAKVKFPDSVKVDTVRVFERGYSKMILLKKAAR